MESRSWSAFFNRGNVSLGWSLLWRVTLVMVPVRLLSRLFAEAEASGGGASAAAGAVGSLFALPVGGNVYLFPLAIPLLLIALDYFGKAVARKRLDRSPAGFVGWSVYWRWALFQLAALAVLGALAALITVAGRATLGTTRGAGGWLLGIGGLVALVVLVGWSLNAAGWALRRVAERAPTVDEVGAAARGEPGERIRIESWTDLFDATRLGWNWRLAAAWSVALLLGPWIFWLARAAVGGGSFQSSPLGLWYVSYAVSSLLEAVAFAYLSHQLRKDWLVPLLMALVVAALTVGEQTVGGDAFSWFWLGNAAVFGLLAYGGLVAGVRWLGASFAGIALGLGAGMLLWGLAMRIPLMVSQLRSAGGELPPGMVRELFLVELLQRPIQALISAALLLFALRSHLQSSGWGLAARWIVPAAESRR